ncbi:L-rhamnose mutarotase [Larkinella knui]|uniref:L-rhamnose mutarotase n=1 Tax=Larkinella knui TaxID=2025310 RepID=A0A3P1CGC2_9BACT|nr:L-rhamnose mutarotase [Larkinella knui]RRB12399.1 L-rhamnose mutarotase [Larkinella knui]
MRTCFALDLKNDPALIAQYDQYHRPDHIWPEIPAGIRAGGILDMQIYRIGTRLFMIVETPDELSVEQAFRKIGDFPRQAEWAVLMGRFQQRLPEAQPGEHWAEMQPVFVLSDTATP